MSSDVTKAVELLDKAVSGRSSEDEIARAMAEFGADDEFMSRLGIRTGMKTAGSMDWIFDKCRGNKALLICTLALLVSARKMQGYEVKSGDTLWGIAKASNCKLEEIRSLNPQIAGDVIHPGDSVVLPLAVQGGSDQSSYEVAKGDTLWGIAKKFGTDVDALAKLNPQIKDINKLSIGDVLNVPGKSEGAKADGGAPAAKVDPRTDYIARVLYAETSTKCDDEEVKLICRVILNRIGSKAFGGSSDAYGVVSRKGQFSCTSGSDGNVNWTEYKRDLNKATERDYGYAEKLAAGDGSGFPASDAVYYCNKSMAEKYASDGEEYGYPPGWESKAWKPVLVKTTKHFCFYKIVSKK